MKARNLKYTLEPETSRLLLNMHDTRHEADNCVLCKSCAFFTSYLSMTQLMKAAMDGFWASTKDYLELLEDRTSSNSHNLTSEICLPKRCKVTEHILLFVQLEL